MNYDYASAMLHHLEKVQDALFEAVVLAESKADPEDFPAIKKSFGMLIAKLDMELVWPIFRQFPDLDTSGIPVPPVFPDD